MKATLYHNGGKLVLSGNGVSRAIVAFLHSSLLVHYHSLSIDDESGDYCAELLEHMQQALLVDFRQLTDKEADKDIIRSIVDRLHSECSLGSGPDGERLVWVEWEK